MISGVLLIQTQLGPDVRQPPRGLAIKRLMTNGEHLYLPHSRRLVVLSTA